MPRQKQTRGRCSYCGMEIAKSAAPKHLAGCPKRQAVIARVAGKSGAPERLFHLRVRDAFNSMFWLELEMRGSSTLRDLDYYLRAIWLECCGHMSQFSVRGWAGDEIPMSRRIHDLLLPGVELTHIYDFGTSSETLVKSVAVREGKPTTKRPIALMVRNLMPAQACIECGQPATQLCMECLIEAEQWGVLCDQHARDHPHDNYGEPLPLVNSPRLGLCGYDGPAEPPY